VAKKQSAKRAFDWRTYSKPVRALTPLQEEAFAAGVLAPILAWAGQDPRTRLEIRARSAALYHRGVSLGRIGGEGPFEADLEPVLEAEGGRTTLDDDSSVATLLSQLTGVRTAVDDAMDAGEEPRNHRSFASALAAGNRGVDPDTDGLVVVDLEHALGRRKFDLVALLRSDGVSGPGGFATPDLAFVDVRVPGQSLTGPGGLSAVADDLADYAKALSGEHLRRSGAEIADLVAQKVRLGLLPATLDVRSVAEGIPHFVVVFAPRDVDGPGDNEAIVDLHDRLSSRHFPTHRLHFLHVTSAPEDGDGLAAGADDLMDYRTFKAYRRTAR